MQNVTTIHAITILFCLSVCLVLEGDPETRTTPGPLDVELISPYMLGERCIMMVAVVAQAGIVRPIKYQYVVLETVLPNGMSLAYLWAFPASPGPSSFVGIGGADRK